MLPVQITQQYILLLTLRNITYGVMPMKMAVEHLRNHSLPYHRLSKSLNEEVFTR